MEHSRFGGSSASRYLNCPGSVVLSEKAPPRLTSVYAEEGTFAHALAEECLIAGEATAQKWLGKPVHHPTVDSEKTVDQGMIDAVNVYLDEVWEAFKDGDDICVEEKFILPAPAGKPGEVFGSNDCAIFSPATGRLTVFDYKHGKGVGVSAFENKQLMFYAAGAVASHPEWDVKEIELVVVQPRGPFPDPVSRWEMPLWQLIDYPARVNDAIKDALSDQPTFEPGDWCRWCPASEICTVREQRFMETAQLDFASVADVNSVTRLPIAEDMGAERMAAILKGFGHLAAWVDSIRDRVEATMLAGGTVPGMKVVEKVGRRKWAANEEDVVGYLTMFCDLDKNDVWPRKLVTITEAEKQLKSKLGKGFAPVKEEITMKFMVKESTGYACVAETDRRPAVVPVEQDFGSVNINSLFDGE